MARQGKQYIVGKANGIHRIFEVRKVKRLGVTLTNYHMEHPRKAWPKFNGIIRNKSAVLHSRDAAREVRRQKNKGLA